MTITIPQLREIMDKADLGKDSSVFDPAIPLRKQGLDSLDMASFVFFIETELDITIPHTEYARLATLQGIADALAENGDQWLSK
jgi:acyl carrier protein